MSLNNNKGSNCIGIWNHLTIFTIIQAFISYENSWGTIFWTMDSHASDIHVYLGIGPMMSGISS